MLRKKYHVSTEDANYSVEYDFGCIDFNCSNMDPCKFLGTLSIEEAKHLRDALSLAIKDAEEDM